MIEQLGYKKVVLRGDSEPAILALRDAIRKESYVEIVLEEVASGEHQAHDMVESVKNLEGQLRFIKDALESRRERRLDGEHQAAQ